MGGVSGWAGCLRAEFAGGGCGGLGSRTSFPDQSRIPKRHHYSHLLIVAHPGAVQNIYPQPVWCSGEEWILLKQAAGVDRVALVLRRASVVSACISDCLVALQAAGSVFARPPRSTSRASLSVSVSAGLHLCEHFLDHVDMFCFLVLEGQQQILHESDGAVRPHFRIEIVSLFLLLQGRLQDFVRCH